jgi:hypothetical protein
VVIVTRPKELLHACKAAQFPLAAKRTGGIWWPGEIGQLTMQPAPLRDAWMDAHSHY